MPARAGRQVTVGRSPSLVGVGRRSTTYGWARDRRSFNIFSLEMSFVRRDHTATSTQNASPLLVLDTRFSLLFVESSRLVYVSTHASCIRISVVRTQRF